MHASIQKYFVIGNSNQRQNLFSQILSNFMEISCDKIGSQVVRKAIDQATSIQLICFIKQCTEQNVVLLAKNAYAYGYHIIVQMLRSATIANHETQVNSEWKHNKF